VLDLPDLQIPQPSVYQPMIPSIRPFSSQKKKEEKKRKTNTPHHRHIQGETNKPPNKTARSRSGSRVVEGMPTILEKKIN
jgi:hypothetical protein